MTASLIIPRCEVTWGDKNLMMYQIPGTSEPQPMVHNVTVSINEEGSTPNGSMAWNPSASAYEVYKSLISSQKYLESLIRVRFFYLSGRSITFNFLWAGHTEQYGVTMDISVKLVSELDGLVNSSLGSSVQTDPTGIDMISVLGGLEKNYGVDGLEIFQYTEKAKADMRKAKITEQYNVQSTFSEAVKSVAAQNGNFVFASNIGAGDKGTSKLTIVAPFTSDDSAAVELLSYQSQDPDVTRRYGYLLGPGIINTVSKTSEWQPPQKSQTQGNSHQPKYEPNPGTGPNPNPNQGQANPSAPLSRSQKAAKGKKGGKGAKGANSIGKQIRTIDNQEGERKKILLQTERTSKMQTNVFMTPSLTGIKPCDVIYFASYDGNFIEDWIVNTVTYKQSNGGVEIDISGSRVYGQGNLMNQKPGEEWLAKAKSWGLVGPDASIDSWTNYAWKEPLGSA